MRLWRSAGPLLVKPTQFAACGGMAFTPPFVSLGTGEAQRFTCLWHGEATNGQRPQKHSQGKARLIPLKREAPQKRKTNTLQPDQDRPEAQRAAKTALSLPERQCRPMQEPCRSEAQADPDALLSPTGEASDDYELIK